MEEANFLSRFGSEVAVVHRSAAFRASKIMLERAQANPKITFLLNTVVEDIYDVSKNEVTGVKLRNVKTGENYDRDVDGFFVAIGHIPNTKPFAASSIWIGRLYHLARRRPHQHRRRFPRWRRAGPHLPPSHHRLWRRLHGRH